MEHPSNLILPNKRDLTVDPTDPGQSLANVICDTMPAGAQCFVTSVGKIFRWFPGSTLTAVTGTIIADPKNLGRWIALGGSVTVLAAGQVFSTGAVAAEAARATVAIPAGIMLDTDYLDIAYSVCVNVSDANAAVVRGRIYADAAGGVSIGSDMVVGLAASDPGKVLANQVIYTGSVLTAVVVTLERLSGTGTANVAGNSGFLTVKLIRP